MSKLYVDNKDIKVSKSSFSIFKNESVKYEGKCNKLSMATLTLILQRQPNIIDALGIEILKTVYDLQFSTSRQITQYLNSVKNIKVEQSIVSKKLDTLNRYSIVSRYSFISDERIVETNMKVYALENNGKILLKGRKFKCDWKYTDCLMLNDIKTYLARNQYLILLYEQSKPTNVRLKPLTNGINLIYSLDNINHAIIVVRNTENYKDILIETVEGINNSPEFLQLMNIKVILIGECDKHLFEMFKVLAQKKILKDNFYFGQDLRLYDRDITKSFVKFGIKSDINPPSVVLIEQNVDDFKIK